MKLCGFDVGIDKPFFLIAGPCVIESREMAFETATALKDICGELGIPFIYKSSYDKANRSSGKSYRGMGMDEVGLTTQEGRSLQHIDDGRHVGHFGLCVHIG